MSQLRRSRRAAAFWGAAAMAVIATGAPRAADEVTVWAISESHVYHCPGSRWYGKGDGREMGECAALHDGYRPVFGTGCGSTCNAQ